MTQAGYDFLYFLAGIFLHMGLLHLFSFYETQDHPMIASARNPYLASKIWGVIQLSCGIIILALRKFQFGWNLPTLFAFLGFSFWAVLLGIVSRNKSQK